jgi:hypothetical protein
MSLE